ncbi:MAG: VOC family protein [Pseudomonadota bacterium]
MQVTGLDHLVLTVADPEASAAWYGRTLGTQTQAFTATDGSLRLALSFGAQKINLHPADAPFAPHAAHPKPGTADLCFLSEAPPQAWIDHLTGLGVEVLEGPVPRTGATGPILSVYLRDPDGNLLEIAKQV